MYHKVIFILFNIFLLYFSLLVGGLTRIKNIIKNIRPLSGCFSSDLTGRKSPPKGFLGGPHFPGVSSHFVSSIHQLRTQPVLVCHFHYFLMNMVLLVSTLLEGCRGLFFSVMSTKGYVRWGGTKGFRLQGTNFPLDWFFGRQNPKKLYTEEVV